VCIVLCIDNSKFSAMDCMKDNQDRSLCVYSFIPDTTLDGLPDPHCVSGETFFGVGKILICQFFGVFVFQIWKKPWV
jgi:hypothetical protein